MPYTREQEDDFKREFALRRKRQLFLAVPLFAAVILGAMLKNSSRSEFLGVSASVWGPAFLLLVLAALVFSFRNWRCPACDRYLGRQISPQFCPKCGVELQ